MTRLKLKDLPKNYKVNKDEMKKIRGGVLTKDIFQTAFTSVDWGGIQPIAGWCKDGSSRPED